VKKKGVGGRRVLIFLTELVFPILIFLANFVLTTALMFLTELVFTVLFYTVLIFLDKLALTVNTRK
jgi:hypothetical protein